MRIENLLREPEFVRYWRDRDFTNPVVIRQRTPEDCYLSLQVAPYGTGTAAAGERRLAPDSSEAVRRDFVANASHELRSPSP